MPSHAFYKKSKRGQSKVIERFRTPAEKLDDECIEKVKDGCMAVTATVDFWGNAPLHVTRDIKRAQFLLDHGADINARNNEGKTVLHLITETPRCYVEQEGKIILVSHFSKEQMQTISSSDYRIMQEEREFVEFLIQHGADINALDNSNCTPLCNTVMHTLFDPLLFDCLLAHGAGVNKGRPSPLYCNSMLDDYEELFGAWTKKLLAHGAH